MSEDTVKDRLRRNLKNATKKEILLSGEEESTEDEEDKVVEKERDQDSLKDAETSETTQEELLEGFSTASAGHLATHDELLGDFLLLVIITCGEH
ncbi:hypothetical protein C2G38_2188467 [Gigaspora rosea]|uniref:Uncharacterized protein n=1 Tax=Gigaspora rosea TaxID=44941 RepID=A0A397VAK6_9GLOM|nr:hypothetical protein C2G38_2188467 [Gigaspora rosea]